MSSDLPVSTVLEKHRLDSEHAFLLMLEIEVVDPSDGAIVEVLRFVQDGEDSDGSPVTHMGYDYQPANFELSVNNEAGEQPRVSVTVRDYNRVLQQRLQDYGGGVGFGVTMLGAFSNELDLPAAANERFVVVNASANDYVINWDLGIENFLTLRFPRRIQLRDRCSWRYKSQECGYQGDLPTCDLTLNGENGCVAHANASRFGGFPGIAGR